MKRIATTLFFLILSVPLVHGQVVTTEPEFPTVGQSVTIYFDATEGTGGLENHNGDVYAHTGISTDQNADQEWKCVKNNWPTASNFTGNRDDTRLSRVEGTDNLYKLEISDIRAYYQDTNTSCSLADDETIETMNFVFRNADGSLEGKAEGGNDIFVEVYQNQFNVKFTQPKDTTAFVSQNSSTTIQGIASTQSSNVATYPLRQ
ncbi:MAG: hypothetical protein U5J63_08640 [Fodinibius sp.]|nr:hypothetical protein [Fodinibius sp.]